MTPRHRLTAFAILIAAAQTGFSDTPPINTGTPTQGDNPNPLNCCECIEIAVSQGTPTDADKKVFINLPGKKPIRIEGEHGQFKFNLDVRVRTTPDTAKPGLDCSKVFLQEIRIIPGDNAGPCVPKVIRLAGQNLTTYAGEILLTDFATRGKWTIEVSCAPSATSTNPTPPPPSTGDPLPCRFPITLDAPCPSCSSGTCAADASSGCFTYDLPLGLANGGDTNGSLQFFTPDFSFPGLAGLHAYVPPSYTVARTTQSFIVTTPTTIVTAIPTTPGATDSLTITHSRVGGLAFRKTTIAFNGNLLWAESHLLAPDGASVISTTRHQQTRSINGGITTYTLQSGSFLPTESFSALRTEVLAITPNITAGTETHLATVSENSITVSSIQSTYTTFPWGWEKTREIIDPDIGLHIGAKLTSTWTYYGPGETTGPAATGNSGATDGYGMLKSYTRYDGYQETHTYWLNTHETKLPFASDRQGLTLTRAWSPGTSTLTTTRKTASGTISMETATYNEATPSITTTVKASSTQSLTTTTILKPFGADFGGQLLSVSRPDGTVTSYSYQRDNSTGVKTVTAVTGTATDGTTETTLYNAFGTVTSHTAALIRDGVSVTTDKFQATEDAFGRQLVTTHFTGSPDSYTTSQSYSCCGVATSTDMHGQTTYYAYDGLRRRIKTNVNGVTTQTTYNGLTTETRRYPETVVGDLSPDPNNELATLIARTTRNNLADTSTTTESPDPSALAIGAGIAGALTATTTTVIYSTAGTATTTTVPGVGSQTTLTYPDGRTYQSFGGLAPNIQINYAVTATATVQGLLTTQAYLVGGTAGIGGITGATLTEPTSTQTDLAGRTVTTIKGSITQIHKYDNSTGQLISVEDADHVLTLYAYNHLGERISTALNLDSNTDINPGTDQVTSTETYPNGTWLETVTKGWELVDDPEDNPDLGAVPVARILSVTRRSPSGLITKSWSGDPAITGNQPTTTETTVGADGAWSETTTRPDGTRSVSSYTNGSLVSRVERDASEAPGALIFSITYGGFDDIKRPTTSTDSRTGTTTTAYMSATCDAVHSVAAPGSLTTSFTYDSRGNRLTTTHPDTSVTTNRYNSKSQLEATWGSLAYATVYSYDYTGRMLTLGTSPTITDNAPDNNTGILTLWRYDSGTGMLTGKFHNYNAANPTDGPTYSYTPAGRLLTRIWKRGVVTTYGHDMGGRINAVTYTDDPASTPNLVYTRDTLGRIKTVTRAGNLHATYTYDPTTLRLATETLNQDTTAARTLNRYYDALGRPVSLEAGTDYTTAYGFDVAGRLNRVWDHPTFISNTKLPAGSASFTYEYKELSAGLVAAVTGPAHTVANIWDDTRDVLLSKTNTKTTGSTVASSYSYTVNSIGQRKKVDRTGTEMSSTNAIGWSYNATGELTKEDFDNDSTASARDLVFQYDAIGNRVKTATATLTLGNSNYTANDLNQYIVADGVHLPDGSVEGVLPAYDADGNYQHGPLPVDYVQDDNATLVWDAENRLVEVDKFNGDVITFAYDHISRRISKSVHFAGAGTVVSRYLYDAWNLIAEYTGTTLKMTYTWGMDLSGGMQGAGGVGGLLAVSEYPVVSGVPVRTPYYPTFDGNGNVSEYLDHDGDKRAHYEYDAFGNIACAATGDKAADFAYRFSTKYFDTETGFYYYGHRWYDPLTGRWPSRDPIEEEGGVNLYAFVGNEGVDKWDYIGLKITHTGDLDDKEAQIRLFNQALVGVSDSSELGRMFVCWALDEKTELVIKWVKKGNAAGGGPRDEKSRRIPNRGEIAVNSTSGNLAAPSQVAELQSRKEVPDDIMVSTLAIIVLGHELGHAILDFDEGATIKLVENPIRNKLKIPERKTHHGDALTIDQGDLESHEAFLKEWANCNCKKELDEIRKTTNVQNR